MENSWPARRGVIKTNGLRHFRKLCGVLRHPASTLSVGRVDFKVCTPAYRNSENALAAVSEDAEEIGKAEEIPDRLADIDELERTT